MAGFGFLGAIGGLGDGLQNQSAVMEKNDQQDKQLNQQKALAQWRLQQEQVYKIAAEERAAAPLKRLGAAADAKMAEPVDAPAPAPTQLTGYNPIAAEQGPSMPGFIGSIADARKQVAGLPEADRVKAQAQLDAQVASDTDLNKALNPGTRKRTADEAFDAALEEAKVKDPQAYAAGKPLATEKTTKVGKDDALINSKTGKLIFANTAGADREEQRAAQRAAEQDERENRRDERQQRALDARAGGGGAAGNAKEVLSYMEGVRKDLADDARNTKTLYAEELRNAITPKQKAAIESAYRPKFADLNRKRGQVEKDFNALRERVGLPSAFSSVDSQDTGDSSSNDNAGGIATPKSKAEYDALPKGAQYIKDGKTYEKR